MKLLKALWDSKKMGQRIKDMFSGRKINTTEGRSVLHVALRKQANDKLEVDGNDVVKDVHETLNRIKAFSEKVRSGTFKGFTGKNIKNIVAIGIGGSFLGPEFVFEALK
jgi:glucose-6-phosphate isomerase